MKRFYSFFILLVACLMTVSVQAAQSLPYSYGFEDNDLATDGWTIYLGTTHSGNNNECGIIEAAKKTGSYGFRFSSYHDSGMEAQYLISPELDDAKGVIVQFSYAASSTSGLEVFKVGYSMTDTDIASFTWGDEISTNKTAWAQTDELSFPVGTKYVALYYYSSYKYRLYVDDFTFIAPSDCQKPTDLAVGDKDATSAFLTWTAGGSETAWEICLNGDEANLIDASENSAKLNDLTPGTQYSVKVRSNCGGEVSGWSPAVSFQTDCAAITSFPWSVNFDDSEAGSGILPLCWSRINTSTSSSYNVYPYVYDYSYYAHSGSKSLYFYSYYSSYSSSYDPQDQYAILPEIDNAAGKQITFWGRCSSGSIDIKIGSIKDPADASTFNEIATKTLTSTYAEYFVELTGAEGNYIAIMMEAANSSSTSKTVYIDDILVENIPNCKKPTDLAVNTTTANSAELTWTSDASAWQICVNDDEENLIDANANPFTLDGLTANTAYSVKVRANCGATEQSEWSNALSFRTECANITTLPWNENFEGFAANTIPECWDNSASASTTISGSTSYYIWGVFEDDDNKLLRMNNFNVQSGTALINSPAIELPASPIYELSFDYAHNASCAAMTVKISEDNGANWTDLQSYSKSGVEDRNHAGTMTEAIINLAAYAGKTIQLQFFTTSDYGQGAVFMDNISIHEVPACAKPSIEDPVILADGATISWTAGNGENRFEYACVEKEAEVADEDWMLLDADVLSVTINGKASGVNYDFYVRAYCSASDKSEAAKKTFAAFCPAPTALQVSDIATNSATISWTAAEGINDYEYVVMAGDADADWTNATLVEAAVSAPLKELDAATSYTVFVRSHYSDISFSSAISKSFTTNCETFAMPFSENFNDLSAGIPNCWDNSEGTTTSATYKWYYYATGHEGVGLRFDSYNNSRNNTNVLATPTIHLDKEAILSFWCKNPKGGAFEVKIAEAGSEDRAVLFDDLTGISAWTLKEADLSAYVGKDVVIYFCATSNYGSNDAYLYLDDIEIYEKPSCSKPTDIVISDVETASAKIAWTAGGSETAWALQTSLDGENWSDEIEVTNPYILTELAASTKYFVRVKAVCSSEDSSDWSEVANFTTSCEAIVVDADHPWVEDFSGHEVGGLTSDAPLCWDMLNANEGNYPYIYVSATGAYSLSLDNNALYFSNQNSKYGYAILPEFATELNTLQIAFSHKEENATNSGKIELGYMTDIADEATFVLLKAFDQITNKAWGAEEYALTAVPSGSRLAFRYKANSSTYYDAAIDNITISVIPACAKPIDVVIDNISQTSAQIAWTAGGSETAWALQTSLDGENWSDEIEVTNPYTLTELTANTLYYVRVKAVCDATDQSDWSIAASFRTECGAVALPFEEGFEEGIDCWTLEHCNASTGVEASAKYEGEKGFKFNYTTAYPQYLISPEFVASELKVKVEFEYKNSSSSYDETFHVGYSTTTSDVDAFTWSDELVANENAWAHYTSDELPAGVKYVAIKHTSNDAYYLFIDNFSVVEVPKDPTALENTGIDTKAIKRLENGVLVIELNGTKYNAQGMLIRK